MLLASASLQAVALLLLGAVRNTLAAPASCSHHHSQVQSCRSHLDDHRAFCCSFLQGRLPPGVENHGVCPPVHYVVTTDATAYKTTTQTAVRALTTTSTHTVTVGSTSTATLPPTATDTVTSTVSSTTYIDVRDYRRRSVSTKPETVAGYADEVIIDACFLLLYSWYEPPSKCPSGRSHKGKTAEVTIHKTLTKTSTAHAVRSTTKVDVQTSKVTTLTTVTVQPDATTTAFVASTTHYERGGYLEPNRYFNFVSGSSDGEALYFTNGGGSAFYFLDTNTGYVSPSRNYNLLLSTGSSQTIVLRSPAEIQAGGYSYLVCTYDTNGSGGISCSVGGVATFFYYCSSESSSTLVYIGATPPFEDCQAVGIQLDDQR